MLVKKLKIAKKQITGRNSSGRLTIFHRGGGHKKSYRMVDFSRKLYDIPGQVVSIEYDPNRTGKIALVCYSIGVMSYILATEGLKVGDWVCCVKSDLPGLGYKKLGSTFFLKDLSVGNVISNLEWYPGSGGKVLRAAGSSGMILKKYEEENLVLIKLNSGEQRLFSGDCQVSFGSVSNINHRYSFLKKAGQSRWRGRRPVVRGVAMNPVDHPHGGGEGKTSGGRPSVTPWGKITKGQKTRKNKKNILIVKRRV